MIPVVAALHGATPVEAQRPAPTHADVSYGPHERNLFDLWLAQSKAPTPLIVYVHGGGFTVGGKEQANTVMIERCVSSGVSFMAINYRWRSQAPIQDILRDGARSIQFMRAHAKKYRIDPRRIAVFGASAGATMSQWLAFHDDIADPASPDPILRESSRVAAAGILNAQATVLQHRWPELVGPRDPTWFRKGDDHTLFGLPPKSDLNSPRFQAILRDVDTLPLITRDDPPVFLHNYNHPDIPARDRNHYVHHPTHLRVIKRACDAAGVPATLSFALGEPKLTGNYHLALFEFFARHLRVGAWADR